MKQPRNKKFVFSFFMVWNKRERIGVFQIEVFFFFLKQLRLFFCICKGG
jgi:hypothetical protein